MKSFPRSDTRNIYRKNNSHIEKIYSEKNKDRLSKYNKEYKVVNKNKNRNDHYKRTYGISLDDYNKMFNDQSGCCLGCKKHQSELKRALSIDHDHKTGEIRGLLCHKCNVVLGLIFDDVTILSNLIKYLSITK